MSFPRMRRCAAELKQDEKNAPGIFDMDGSLFVRGKLIIPTVLRAEMLSI
jgi:hypothetical protein